MVIVTATVCKSDCLETEKEPEMPYRICKTLEVENAHMLSKHPDNCKFPHGHTRKIEFVLESEALDQNDMVCDFKIIKETVLAYVERLDHAMCMNSEDPSFALFKEKFGERVLEYNKKDPTTEVIAKDIFDECTARLEEYRRKPDQRYPLGGEVRLVKVRVWETPSSWAEFEK